MIRLRTLGSLQLQDADGSDVDALLAQSRRVALLAYLALAFPRGFHRRDRLLALFWPEHDETHARNALSQSVHVLRRVLGAGVIVSRADDELGLDPKALWCDATAFDEALEAGRIADAVALYRGPVLDGFHVSNAAPELDRWLEDRRNHYARRYATAVEQMADSCCASGDTAGCVHWWRRLAALDPFSSRAAVGLMRALIASREPALALQHARVHETLLREDLGVGPDPAVTALVRQLTTPLAVADPPSAPTPAVQPTAALTSTAAPTSTPAATPAATPAGTPARSGDSLSSARRMALARLRPLVPFTAVLVLAIAGGLALSRARNATGVPAIGCVAVLPLADLSADPGREYLAEGITDAIITALARYERPTVISHTSTMRFRNTRASTPEIGRALNCDALVEGTVMRDGGRVRVAARLIHAANDRQLWADSYERDVTDLLLLERQAAEAIAQQVRAVVASGMAADAADPPRVDPLTYAIYLRARNAFQSRNPATLTQALALFKQTVERDSAFAPGYAGLSDTYRMIGGLGYGPLSFVTDSADALARQALSVNPSSAEAHTSLAAVLTDQGNWPRAEDEYRKAIALRPGYAQAHAWYAALLVTLDRKAEALREIRRASDLDPLTQPIVGLRVQIETYAGVNVGRGRPGARKALVDPTHPGTIAARSLNLARTNQCPEAYAENRNAQQLAPNVTMIQLSLAIVHTLCGQPALARALLDTVEQHPDARLMSAYIAAVHVARGDRDSAFAWLERGQWGMLGRMELRMGRQLDPLRSDPRFPRLLHSVGMP